MEFLKALESIRSPFLDTVISLITHLGAETLFMVGALIFFWCVDKYRGYFLICVGGLGIVFNQFLKMLFRIPRPWELDPSFTIVESAREGATGYSFPSGHTQSATTLYGGIARTDKHRAVQIGGVVMCLLIAFSRMYLGVHTPKDVLVSLAIGAILIFVCYPLVERSKENPIYMYCIIAFAFLLTLGNLLFVMLYHFPADVDPVNLEDARENAWKLMAIIVGTVFLYPIERKWIRFETKAVWWAQILKLLGGVIILLGVRIGLKAPFNALFGVYVGGALRYFLMLIAGGLLWPITFKWFAKLGQPKKSIEQ